MTAYKKNIVGITMGDLNGVGPEIIVQALGDLAVRELADFVIFGSEAHLIAAAELFGIKKFWKRVPKEQIDFQNVQGVILADYSGFEVKEYPPKPDADSGRASLEFCSDAIDAAIAGKIDAIVTAPINKISWKLAGASFPGHTELLAEKCKIEHKAMMFAAGKLKLALATIHEAFRDVPKKLDIPAVSNSIRLLNAALKDYFGIVDPKIGVAALNPHAGEDGRFGNEEKMVIAPAIEALRKEGVNATGPLPADTLFLKASRGDFDGVVAMYHDQGMIPVKLMAFEEAVNVTIGLPIIRTSPAHGTAFDIAGEGKVDPTSMKRAIETALLITKKTKAKQADAD